MVMPSRGIQYTLVNGVVTYAGGALTGAAAGRVLRS
jgi:N-acyl-D-aspartate/D-glutamate deacylase